MAEIYLGLGHTSFPNVELLNSVFINYQFVVLSLSLYQKLCVCVGSSIVLRRTESATTYTAPPKPIDSFAQWVADA